MALYDNWTWDGTTLIIVQDDVKGYDEDHAYDLSDIQACITAKGWAVDWTEVSPNIYLQGMRIILDGIGGQCWLVDADKILVQKASINYAYPFRINSEGYLYLGEIINADLKTTRHGCILISAQPILNAVIFRFQSSVAHGGFYDCQFKNIGYFDGTYDIGFCYAIISHTYDLELWNCSFSGCGPSGKFDTVYNVLATNVSYAIPNNILTSCENVWINRCYWGTQLTGGNKTIKNVLIVDAERYDFFIRGITGLHYLINVICGWNVVWHSDDSGDNKVYRQYEFNAHCIDEDNNNLSGVLAVGEYISPYGGAFSDTSDGSGNISTQTVDRSWYEQATGNTENLKIPLKVTYSKAGFEILVKYYDMAEKVQDCVVLCKVKKSRSKVFKVIGRQKVKAT